MLEHVIKKLFKIEKGSIIVEYALILAIVCVSFGATLGYDQLAEYFGGEINAASVREKILSVKDNESASLGYNDTAVYNGPSLNKTPNLTQSINGNANKYQDNTGSKVVSSSLDTNTGGNKVEAVDNSIAMSNWVTNNAAAFKGLTPVSWRFFQCNESSKYIKTFIWSDFSWDYFPDTVVPVIIMHNNSFDKTYTNGDENETVYYVGLVGTISPFSNKKADTKVINWIKNENNVNQFSDTVVRQIEKYLAENGVSDINNWTGGVRLMVNTKTGKFSTKDYTYGYTMGWNSTKADHHSPYNWSMHSACISGQIINGFSKEETSSGTSVTFSLSGQSYNEQWWNSSPYGVQDSKTKEYSTQFRYDNKFGKSYDDAVLAYKALKKRFLKQAWKYNEYKKDNSNAVYDFTRKNFTLEYFDQANGYTNVIGKSIKDKTGGQYDPSKDTLDKPFNFAVNINGNNYNIELKNPESITLLGHYVPEPELQYWYYEENVDKKIPIYTNVIYNKKNMRPVTSNTYTYTRTQDSKTEDKIVTVYDCIGEYSYSDNLSELKIADITINNKSWQSLWNSGKVVKGENDSYAINGSELVYSKINNKYYFRVPYNAVEINSFTSFSEEFNTQTEYKRYMQDFGIKDEDGPFEGEQKIYADDIKGRAEEVFDYILANRSLLYNRGNPKGLTDTSETGYYPTNSSDWDSVRPSCLDGIYIQTINRATKASDTNKALYYTTPNETYVDGCPINSYDLQTSPKSNNMGTPSMRVIYDENGHISAIWYSITETLAMRYTPVTGYCTVKYTQGNTVITGIEGLKNYADVWKNNTGKTVQNWKL